MAAASLVVRISADINSFSKNLRTVTRDVDAAAKRVSEIGKSMSIGVTLPLVAAAAAFTKFGMEQAATSAKFSRQFGPAAAALSDQFERITKIVPVTGGALQDLANSMNQFGRGAGMAAPQAALFSGEAVKMAAVLKQATPGATLEAAGDALTSAFEGSTKGLRKFDVTIDASQVKQEAYRLGLLKIGNELTPLGTALATYALLTGQVNKLQANSIAVQRDVGTQLAFLKQQAGELAEKFGLKLAPAFSVLIQAGRDLVGWLSSLSDGTIRTALYVGAFAAALGPAISLTADMAASVIKLYEATKLLVAAGSLEKLVAILTNPTFVVGALLLTAAIYGLTKAWTHFSTEAKSIKTPTLTPPADIQQLLKLAGSAPTSAATGDPLAQLRESVDLLTQSYEQALQAGRSLTGITEALRQKKMDVRKFVLGTNDEKQELGGSKLYLDIGTALAKMNLTSIIGRTGARDDGGLRDAAALGSQITLSPGQVMKQIGDQLISDASSLRMREALVSLADTFDASRVAVLQLAEKFRQVSHDFAVSLIDFKKQWSGGGGASALAGLKEGALGAMQAFTPMALAAAAVGKVMQGFQPVIDNLLGPLVAFGQILSEIAEPILRPLFQSLKAFGIAVALIGEVVYTVAAGITRLIGNLIVAIGSFIRKIPFLGGIGKEIQNVGNGMLDLSKSFSSTAHELDQSRIQLQNLDFKDAANGLSPLADSTNAATEAMTNMPQAFKLNLAKYVATLPINNGPVITAPGGYGGGTAPSGYGPGSENTNSPAGHAGTRNGGGDSPNSFNIYLDGKMVGQALMDRMRSSASRQFGDPTRIHHVTKIT